MCMPPLETRTDSPGETPEVPQGPCQHWRGTLTLRHRLHKGLSPQHRRERNPVSLPEQLEWVLAFPRPPERVPEVPVVSQEHLPQLEKIQEVLPSRRDEALFL